MIRKMGKDTSEFVRQICVSTGERLSQADEALRTYTGFDFRNRKLEVILNSGKKFVIKVKVGHIFSPLTFESGELESDDVADAYIMCWETFSDMIIIFGCLSKGNCVSRSKRVEFETVAGNKHEVLQVEALDLNPIDSLVSWIDRNAKEVPTCRPIGSGDMQET